MCKIFLNSLLWWMIDPKLWKWSKLDKDYYGTCQDDYQKSQVNSHTNIHDENNRKSATVTKIKHFPFIWVVILYLCTIPSNYYLNCMGFHCVTERTTNKSFNKKKMMWGNTSLCSCKHQEEDKGRRFKPN